jgi:hypothetical protein
MHVQPRTPAGVTRLPRRGRRPWGVVAAALLLLPSCSAHDDAGGTSDRSGNGSGAGGQRAGASDGPRVELKSRVTRVAGHLSAVRRERVERQARATVEDYLQGAFAGGDRPFADFVPALRRQAAADAAVLRSRAADGTTRANAWVAVAAPRGRAVGATARIAVTVPDGGSTSTLTGRLLLTVEGSRWRVFGYDLARGDR